MKASMSPRLAKDEQAAGNVWARQLLHTAKHEGYEALREKIAE